MDNSVKLRVKPHLMLEIQSEGLIPLSTPISQGVGYDARGGRLWRDTMV